MSINGIKQKARKWQPQMILAFIVILVWLISNVLAGEIIDKEFARSEFFRDMTMISFGILVPSSYSQWRKNGNGGTNGNRNSPEASG